jgi:hypothetical protein
VLEVDSDTLWVGIGKMRVDGTTQSLADAHLIKIYFYASVDISSTVQQQYYRTDGRVVKALASGASHASGVGSSPTLFTISFADLIGSFCGSVRMNAFSPCVGVGLRVRGGVG